MKFSKAEITYKIETSLPADELSAKITVFLSRLLFTKSVQLFLV
jgi:hypothetical protein